VRDFLHCTIEQQNTRYAILAEGTGRRGWLKAKGTNKRVWLKFDGEDMTDIQRLKCVVVGREPGRSDEQAQYVLVVTQRLEGGNRTYERVGVGSIQRRHISFEEGESEREFFGVVFSDIIRPEDLRAQ
jgi:hypothetical protein